MRDMRRDPVGDLWHVGSFDMIFARRTLLFSGMHNVSTALRAMTRVITGTMSLELVGDIVAGRIVFHR